MLISSLLRADREYTELSTDFCSAAGTRSLPFLASGLCDGAAKALITALIEDLKSARRGAALLVLPEEKQCVALQNYLAANGLHAAFYIARDLNFYNITASHDYEYERLFVLRGLLDGEFDAVLTTPDAALGYTISREKLRQNTLSISANDRITPQALCEKLLLAGYTRVEMVEGAGQFAARGGIVDIFAPRLRAISGRTETVSGALPLRIEFFGDEIDRMGVFDVDSQRVHTMITDCEIPPAREVLIDGAAREKIRKAVAERLKKCTDERARKELQEEAEALQNAAELRFADKYMALAEESRETLLSYFPDYAPVVLRGSNAVRERLRGALRHQEAMLSDLLESGTISGKIAAYSLPETAFSAFLDRSVVLYADSIAEGLSGKRFSAMFSFSTKHTPTYRDRPELLEEDLKNYREAGWRVILSAENESAAKNAAGLLAEHGFSVSLAENGDALPESGKVLVTWSEQNEGFELAGARAAVLSLSGNDANGGLSIAGKSRHRQKKKDSRAAILSYADLQVGDLVVHEAHGIGRYMGLETLTIGGVTRDYVHIQYAGSDKLFLPCDRLDAVSKYIGAHPDDGMVRLSRFGGGEWKKAKERAKSAVKDMAKDLIALYARRARTEGFAFPDYPDMQREFDDMFPFEETEGQETAEEEIRQDMMASAPMDRLLCGDVGFGKTEVALRAAYMAVLAGKQVALLVPTTILALQHFETVSARMRPFAVRVEMISRFRSAKEQTQILRRLARGDVDIIIGTHRLVSSDIKFKDLGLLIVDEEQRFGVAQKEKIKAAAGNVDVLTLTATPIPRTLNMAMSGIRDISILDEAPGDRLPVQTYVLEEDPLIIEEAIRRELRRGGQVFYLHNNVENINSTAAAISRAVPEARVTVAHGQMDKEELERIWGDMLSGEIDILVSTTIIETGIDVPNANTLIVDNAHCLGLSQLHQIRGRVGRSPRRAYAYFTYPAGRALSDIQRKRLEAVREYTEFGAGFRIALRDLELRGAGNLLGAEQHGHLDAVGYDLYVKLLNEAVLEEKGQKTPTRTECIVSLSFDACLPEKYVRSAGQRIALYKRISLISTRYDFEDMREELSDRYGDLPAAAENLLKIALVRSLAERCGVTQLRQEENTVHIISPKLDVDKWLTLSAQYPGKLRMMLSENPYIQYRPEKVQKTPELLIELFERYLALSADKINQAEEEQ